MNYSINPKEAYLLEQFSSLTFFETMRNNHRLFLDSLEELFEIYDVVPLIRPLNLVL